MKYSKYELKLLREEKRKADLVGRGVYIYENNTPADLLLPRKTKAGVQRVAVVNESIPGSGQFTGDDYYMFMVPRELKLVQVVEPAYPERTIMSNTKKEDIMTENAENSQKLITEQPPTVTTEGTVEFVEEEKKKKKLNENQPATNQPDTLINEDPMDGIEII